MASYIVGILNSILGEQNFVGTTLLVSPQNYAPQAYNYVIGIMNHVIKPIAYTVLALFCLLELYQITVRNSDSTKSFEIPFKLMFKTILCKIVVDYSDSIMSCLFDISSAVITGIQGVMGNAEYSTNYSGVDLEPLVDSMGFGEQLMLALIVTLLFIAFQVIAIFVTVTVSARILELYVLTAISPLPLATFPNETLRNTGINFLKYFFSVCLQGALMFLVLSLFSYLSAGSAIDAAACSDYLTLVLALFGVLGDLIILFLGIKKSGQWAKSICNAM